MPTSNRCRPSLELLPDIHTIDDLLAAYHGFVAGITGGGKSIVLERLHAWNNLRVSLYINPSGAVAGTRARTPDDIRRLIVQGHRKIYWTPPDRWAARTDDDGVSAIVDHAIRPLKLIGERKRGDKDKIPPWCAIFCSEVHKFAWKLKDDSLLRWVASEGRKEGIHLWGDSQRPASVNHTILTQSLVHILMRVNQYENPYFKTIGIPYDELAPVLEKPYHFALLYAGRYSLFKPLNLRH